MISVKMDMALSVLVYESNQSMKSFDKNKGLGQGYLIPQN